MSKTEKVFRDPIYNIISFNKEKQSLLIDLIDCPEIQRLKRIRQLGVSNLTYTSATHDRFSHSVGVAHLVGKFVDHLFHGDVVLIEDTTGDIEVPISEFKLLLQAAGLLHDVGHGPFSHTFENISKIKHEKLSSLIIEREDGEIHRAFLGCGNKYIKEHGQRWISEILNGTFPVSWGKEIISSQLDADRIDYLLRDAYMCGVKYATFDVDWLLHNMEIREIPAEGNREGIVINSSKGLHSLESFIVSRYHMYNQVYFHKTTRGFEQLLSAIFNRVSFLLKKDKEGLGFIDSALSSFVADNTSIVHFLRLDDFYMITHINIWANSSKDVILKDLCDSFIQRKPYKMIGEHESNESIPISEEAFLKIYDALGENKQYFYFKDSYIDNPYKDTYLLGKSTADEAEKIWVFTTDEEIVELSELSPIIKSLKNNISKKSRGYLHRNKLGIIKFGG